MNALFARLCDNIVVFARVLRTLLAQLPERDRKKFRQHRSWPIPGTDRRKMLEVMTHVELSAVLQGSGIYKRRRHRCPSRPSCSDFVIGWQRSMFAPTRCVLAPTR